MRIEGSEPFFLPGGKKGVLLLHGFTGLSAELRLLGDALHRAGFTVLCVRLAGHGTSPEDLERTRGEDWIDTALDGYDILRGTCDEISVCGHSMGACLSLILSTEVKIARLALLAAPIFVAAEQGLDRLPPRKYCKGFFVPKGRRHLKDVPAGTNNTYREMPLASIHELLDIIERAKGRLPAVNVPTLIMHSIDDHTASPESAFYIEKTIPAEVKPLVLLKTAGHLLPVTSERETVFRIVTDFFLGKEIERIE